MKNINNSLSFIRSGLLERLLLVNLLLSPIVTLTTNIPIPFDMSLFENVSLSTVDIIKNNGYAVEVHQVVTEDGYVLELHRIPKSKSGQEPFRNHPVFIHHGILGSSADWVLGGADRSLPMQLADAGYDVWLANCRGNTYSTKHVSITSKQRAFWNFSLNEIGKYDLPAAFDHVLMNTSAPQLHYIGYSMGSCVFFIMASERPEYQSKIRSQISLAPVAYLSNTRSSLRYFAPYAKMINIFFQRISKGMLMPQSRMQTFLANTVCKERITQKLICEKCIIFSVCGSDPHFFDNNLIPLIMGHFPAGTSSKLAVHFAQFILKDSFGQYDYGPNMNMHHYNSTVPPSYDLKSIQVPITLIYGENDILATTEDVMRLKAQLPKLMDVFPVNNSYCNHVDFLWSLNVTRKVNDPIKEILNTTDAMDWKYSGLNPTAMNVADHKDNKIPFERPPNPSNNLNVIPSLDYFVENLDAIIANTMPRSVDENDVAEFQRERDLQKMLFANVIEYIKSTEKLYNRLQKEFTNEISDWTDYTMASISVARDTVETHLKKTTVLLEDKVRYAGKSVVGGVANAENAVAVGVSKAENAVVVGVSKAENAVVVGVSKTENFVVGGVAKAEKSIVGRIVQADYFLNYGLNKANQTVVNIFNAVWSRKLNRGLRFFK